MEPYVKLLPTMPNAYKGCKYWIDGSLLEYRFYIDRGGKTTPSENPYPTIVAASLAAREAIDSFTAIASESKPEPETKKSTSRRGVKK